MALRVESSTDGKYIGGVFPVDPHSPPEAIEAGDGTRFEPTEWTEFEPGLWRIRNPHYCVIAREV